MRIVVLRISAMTGDTSGRDCPALAKTRLERGTQMVYFRAIDEFFGPPAQSRLETFWGGNELGSYFRVALATLRAVLFTADFFSSASSCAARRSSALVTT